MKSGSLRLQLTLWLLLPLLGLLALDAWLTDRRAMAAAHQAFDRTLAASLGDTGGLDLWLDRLEAVADARRAEASWEGRVRSAAERARAADAVLDVALCLDVLRRLGHATDDEEQECAAVTARLGIDRYQPLPDCSLLTLLQSPE